MKRLIALSMLLISLFILPTTSLAVTTDTQGTQNNQITEKSTLTLDDALKLVENNIDIKLLDEKIKVADRQYKEALDRANYLKGKDFSGKDQDEKINYIIDQKITASKNLHDLNSLKHDRDEKIKSLKIDIENKFTNASMLQDDITSYQTAIGNYDKQINETKLRIKMGTATDIELKPIEVQRVQVVSLLNSTKRQLDQALLELKKDLGIDLNNEITITPLKLEYKKYDDSDIEKKISNSLENSYDFKNQTEALDLAKAEYEIVKENTDMDGSLVDLHNREMDIANKEVDLQDIKPQLEVTLWTSYNNLKNLEDAVEVERLNLESAQINLNTVSAQVKVGMKTSISELDASLKLDQQKNRLQRAINSYMLGIRNFENQLDQ